LKELKKSGIESSAYFSPIHLQIFYAEEYGYKKGDFPITEFISDRTIALPFYRHPEDSARYGYLHCPESL